MTLGSVATRNKDSATAALLIVNYHKLICSYLFSAIKIALRAMQRPNNSCAVDLQLSFGLLKHSSVCWSCRGGKGGQGLIQHHQTGTNECWTWPLAGFEVLVLTKLQGFFLCLSCFGLFCFLGYFLPWDPMILNREKSNLQATSLS